MEKDNAPSPEFKSFAPDKGDMLTRILNGIGNATMLAAIPLAFFTDMVPKDNRKTFFAITGTAVALGAWWGYSEAKQHRQYRNTLTDEIKMLRHRVEALETQNADWQKKMIAKREQEKAESAQLS